MAMARITLYVLHIVDGVIYDLFYWYSGGMLDIISSGGSDSPCIIASASQSPVIPSVINSIGFITHLHIPKMDLRPALTDQLQLMEDHHQCQFPIHP